jgi:hypothetical protein
LSPPTENDLDALKNGLRNIAVRYRTTFESLVGKRSALLEYAALLLAVERYAEAGYSVDAKNLVNRNLFRVKKNSNGNPWNFSWYEVSRGPLTFELLTNAKVNGGYAFDDGTYVVDVAVLPGGSVARARAPGKAFNAFANSDLKTFMESKALKVYPMLLAQFVGIVLEVTPRFVTAGRRRPRGHLAHGHFDPTLVALGSFSANADRIRSHYPDRGYRINVVSRFDVEAARGTLREAARELMPELD